MPVLYNVVIGLDLSSLRRRIDADGTVAGIFQGSAVEAGGWQDDRRRLCASFGGADRAGPKHSAVCLSGTEASGRTWAEHRSFRCNWNATRRADAP